MKSLPPLKVSFWLLLLAGLIVVAGCKATPEIKPEDKPDLEQLLETIKWRSEKLENIDVEFTADIKYGNRDDRIQLIIVAQKPDKLFLEAVGPIGIGTLGMFSSDGEVFRHYNPKEQAMHFGPATDSALSTMLPMNIPQRQMLEIVMATPRMVNAERKAFGYDYDEKKFRYTVINDSKRQDIWFSHDGEIARTKLGNSDGSLVYDLAYRGWKRHGENDFNYPSVIRFRMPSKGVEIKLKASGDIKINHAPPASIFRLPFPKGVEKIYIPGDAEME